MKKTLILGASTAILSLFLVGCSGDKSENMIMYGWAEDTSQQIEENTELQSDVSEENIDDATENSETEEENSVNED